MDKKIYEILSRSLTNITQNYIDNYIEQNAQFRAKAGLKEKIIRSTNGKCCKWCDRLAGAHSYPAPKEVYQRHDNCDCTVTYISEKGTQDVHTKKAISDAELQKRIESIKKLKEADSISIARERKKRIAKAQAAACVDVTDEWVKEARSGGSVEMMQYAVIDGKKHYVDGKNVLSDFKADEYETAKLIQEKLGVDVKMVPRVLNPQKKRTPDYIINNIGYDKKRPTGKGKNTIYNNLKSAKGQADNVILDITLCGISEEEVIKEIERLYHSTHLRFLDTVIIIKNNEIVKIFERVK